MKKFTAILLAAVLMAGVLAGCGGKTAASSAASSSKPAASSAASSSKASSASSAASSSKASSAASSSKASSASSAADKTSLGKGKKIAMICDTIGTNLFLTQCRDKLDELKKTYGYTDSVMECADTDEWQTNYEAAVQEGYDLILGIGWQSAEYAKNLADANKGKTKFAVIDTDAKDQNVTSISYNEEQAAYIMGVMAGAAFPKEQLYGYIGCFEGSGSWKYRWGFMEGVKSVNPSAKFTFNFTNSYSDTSIAYEYAMQQQSQGCKYIFGAAAAANEGIFQAALELAKSNKNIYTVGQDADCTTKDNPYIISSQLKNTGVSTGNIIDWFFAGTMKGGNIEQALKDNAIGATNITASGKYMNKDILTDAVVAKVKASVSDIISGKLTLKLPDEASYKM